VPGFAGQSDLRQQNHIARHDTCIPNITPLRPTAVAMPPEVCAAAFNREKRMMHTTAFQCRRTRLGENCRRKGSHCRGKLTWGCSVTCKPLPALGSDQCSVQARSSESNRTHGARAAPNLALRARKPHLDGLLRCRRCGLGQERCAGPGGTRTGGIRGSETRPTSKTQNSGAGARRSPATRKRAPTGPRGRCRADPSGGASSGPNKRGPTPCNRPQASPDEAVRALPERSRHTAGSRATQPPRRWRPNATADQPLPRGTQRCSLHVCSAAIARAWPRAAARRLTTAVFAKADPEKPLCKVS